MHGAGKDGANVFNQLGKSANMLSYLASGTRTFMLIRQAITKTIANVKELDSAMIGLRKVTEGNNASFDAYLKNVLKISP